MRKSSTLTAIISFLLAPYLLASPARAGSFDLERVVDGDTAMDRDTAIPNGVGTFTDRPLYRLSGDNVANFAIQ
jgi:hypothetical protein